MPAACPKIAEVAEASVTITKDAIIDSTADIKPLNIFDICMICPP